MFDQPFAFRKVSIQNEINTGFLIRTIKYVFDIGKKRFVVDVEHYQHDFYIIKFYPKRLADYRYRFNILTEDYRATRAISTCLFIIKEILVQEKNANFGFLGSPIYDPKNKKMENRANNKRFRIYKYAFENFFGTSTFTHYIDPNSSTYMIVNNKNVNPDLLMESATIMFSSLYPDLNNL